MKDKQRTFFKDKSEFLVNNQFDINLIEMRDWKYQTIPFHRQFHYQIDSISFDWNNKLNSTSFVGLQCLRKWNCKKNDTCSLSREWLAHSFPLRWTFEGQKIQFYRNVYSVAADALFNKTFSTLFDRLKWSSEFLLEILGASIDSFFGNVYRKILTNWRILQFQRRFFNILRTNRMFNHLDIDTKDKDRT